MGRYRRSGTSYWRHKDGHPPFNAGDTVTLNGNYKYPGWGVGEARTVIAVNYSENEDRWTLAIANPQSPFGVSNYNPHNFMKGPATMYERIKYFAAKIVDGDMLEIQINGETSRNGDIMNTEMRDSKHQVQVDVAEVIKHGDKWLVLQTVAMIEGEEPRPPIRITEYK